MVTNRERDEESESEQKRTECIKILKIHIFFKCLLYSTAEEGHCDLAEIFIFFFVSSLYVLATLTHGPDDTNCLS